MGKAFRTAKLAVCFTNVGLTKHYAVRPAAECHVAGRDDFSAHHSCASRRRTDEFWNRSGASIATGGIATSEPDLNGGLTEQKSMG